MIIFFRRNYYWVLFGLIFLMLAFLQYYGLVRFHYPVPAGDDAFAHYTMAKPYFDRSIDAVDAWKLGAYPPFYHILIANIAFYLKTDLLSVINWTYPALIIFGSLAIFTVTYYLFGKWQAMLAFFLYSFTGVSNIQLLFDGGYPNLLATHILLPFCILFYIKFFTENKIKRQIVWLLLTILISLLIIVTHHTSTFYLFGIIGTSLPFILIWKWISKQWNWKKSIFLLFLIVISYSIALYAFFYTKIFEPVKTLYLYGTTNFDPAGFWGLRHYPKGIGVFIFILGIVGLFILLLNLLSNIKEKKNVIAITFGFWSLLLFTGSRLHMANPERFARDLIVPLSICSGLLIAYLGSVIKRKSIKFILSFLTILLVAFPIINRVRKAIEYEPMVRITQADLAAIEMIKEQSDGGKILTNSQHLWLKYYFPQYELVYNTENQLIPDSTPRFNYVYSISFQKGWSSKPIKGFKNNENYKMIGRFESLTNQIDLYKIQSE